MKLSNLVRALAALAAAVVPLAPAGAQSSPADTLVVYNAQHESLTRAWVEGFTRDTGIKVTLRQGGDSEMANQLLQEGTASPADVFLTENSPAMMMLDRAGLLAPLDAKVLQQVERAYRPADGRWVGIAARATVFVYNRNRLKPEELPKSIMDLARPEWKGRWGASPSGADFQAIVAAMLALRGEAATLDWLGAMKANATIYRGNGNVLRAVNAGQVDGGVIYHYYYFGDQSRTGENSRNVGQHYFGHQDPGAFVSVSGGGILASSRRRPAAQAFLAWITGKGGQDILRTGNSFEYAVGAGATSNPALVPLARLDAPQLDPSQLDNRKVIDLMTRAGLL